MSDFFIARYHCTFLFSQLKKRKQAYYHNDIAKKNIVHECKT